MKHSAFQRIAVFFVIAAITVSAPFSNAFAQFNAFEDPKSGDATVTDLKAKSPVIDAGGIELGTTASVIALFNNSGIQPITVKDVKLFPPSNITAVVDLNQCTEKPLAPSAECAITIEVTGNQLGPFQMNVLVTHSGQSQVTSLNVTGEVSIGGDSGEQEVKTEIEADPVNLDFGTQNSHTPLVRAVAIRNPTSSAVNIENIILKAPTSSGFRLVDDNCGTLEPRAACVMTVSWSPTLEGTTEGVILLEHTGATSVLRVGVKGAFTIPDTEAAAPFPQPVSGKGLLLSDRTDIDFGSGLDSAAAITVSLVNQGDAPLNIQSIRTAGSDSGLSLDDDECRGKTLDSGDACSLTVNWLPLRAGPIIDDIRIRHTGVRGTLVLPVRGDADTAASGESSVLSVIDMPKLPASALDTSKLSGATSEDVPPTPSSRGIQRKSGPKTPSLDGYKVTSLAKDRAIIASPTGRRVVYDGKPVILSGAQWIPRITTEGVELIDDQSTILLLFDESLDAMGVETEVIPREGGDS